MRSWPGVHVPHIPGSPSVRLVVHDTKLGRPVESAPDGTARLYVCGITPYDATHLGHAATYLAFDLLQRQWLDRGLDLRYVQNNTDVDDPLLERATETGVNWVTLGERETDRFRDDMTALRILPPTDYVGVVESVELIVDLIQRLGAAAYAVDGDVYFDLTHAPHLGDISHLDEAVMRELFAQRGGDPERLGKRHALDPLMWRAARDGEPDWPSPWGPGRPGWHVGCSAIATHHLGTDFDVQGGGSDLVFPHHEMCAGQIESTGKPFAKTYVHTGMLAYKGEKMSKSLGNLVFVSKLREAGHDPMAIRLALLAHHYRENWEWHDGEIVAAEQRLERWRAAVARTSAAPSGPAIERIRAALADDLDAPRALDVMDAWASDGSDGPDGRAMADAIDALLGVEL